MAPLRFFKRLDALSKFLFISLALLVLLNIVVVVSRLNAGRDDRPLSNYSAQRMTTEVDGARPSLFLGTPATVSGRKCNSSGAPISVTYLYSWRTVEGEEGISVPSSSGKTDMLPGCQNIQSTRNMPSGVQRITAERIDAGEPYVEWFIQGIEALIDDEGTLGQIKYWRTNKFRIYPEP